MTTGVLTLPEEQYRAAEGVAISDLDWIAAPRTPAHYRARKLGIIKTEETHAMRLGTLVHRCVLEPDTMDGAFVVRPEGMKFTTKDGIAWRDAQTLPILGQEEADDIKRMRDSVLANPIAAAFIKGAKTEQCLFAEDEHGTLRKGRIDVLCGGNVVPDLKTCVSAHPDEFSKAIVNYRYHAKGAWYVDLCNLLGIKKDKFAFICVEKTAPYLCAVHVLDDVSMEFGRRLYQADLALLRHCEAEDSWPGYPKCATEIGLPEWELKKLEACL